MRTLLVDLRYACRILLKTPGFAAIAIIALALGIGATTAMFGVIYAFLLRPLPYAEPGRLVMLQSRSTRSGSDLGVNYLDFKDWKAQARSFEDLAFFNLRWNGNLEARDGITETLKTTFTTANLFELLGVEPIRGRNLISSDDRAGAAKVMLISHRLWTALGSEQGIVGRELRLDGTPRTVVGVMPPGFRFPSQSDVWVPMASVFEAGTTRSWRADQVIARLKAGVSPAEAQAEMSVIAERLSQQFADTNRDIGARVVDLREHWVGDVRSALLLLLCACGGVLVIACANVSQLLLARASTRQRELAVRAALGASRGRLVRQLLTESALLGILGSIVGGVFAFWLVDVVAASIPIELPFWIHIDVNAGVLAFAALVSCLTGVVSGSLPAWQATQIEITHSLRSGGMIRAFQTRDILTAAQVAVAVILVVGASILLRSVMQLRQVNAGFDPRNVLMMEVNPTYNADESAQVRVDRFSRLLQRIAAIPGVETAASNNSPPFVPQRPWNRTAITAEGQPVEDQGRNPLANFQTVSPGYFSALRIRQVRGRLFDERDNLGAPGVCVVSERLAQTLWPGQDASGRRLKLGAPDDDAHPNWLTVVGIVDDVRHQALEREAGPDLYNCSLQLAWKQMHFVVRARPGIDAESLAPAIRVQVAASGPGTGVFNFTSLEKEVTNSLWQRRLQGWLLGFFSTVALTLATAGLYGVMAYGVAQRTREIGIRIALGATRSAVLRLVLGQGIRAVAIGMALGVTGALILARVLRASVGDDGVASYAIACLLLALAALLACWLPARRATHVNPSDALRSE
ncbi:MAG: ABC transporter permease [Chthoniobacterales bacterium]|nr:ABC transporter permease [Chthoniobacterales bacterium]